MSSSTSLVINCGASHVAAALFSAKNDQLVLEDLVTHELHYDYTNEDGWLQALANGLRGLSKTHPKIRGKATFILPGYQLITKPIKVPHVDAAKQAQIIAFEAQNQLPFPLNEVVWGSQIIADDGVETEVILIAQKIEQANRFCGLMSSLGFEPVALQPASILDYSAYKFVAGAHEEDTLLVNIGARSTNLTFINPVGFFIRNINVGGNTLTQMIADGIGKPFAQAEEIKVTFYSGQTSFDANDPAVAPIQTKADDFMKRLSQEITRSIVAYRRSSSRAAPQRILLTGRGALLNGLSEFLCESQKVSVDYFNPTTVLAYAPGADQAAAEQFHYQLSEVIGDAARLVKADSVGANLLPAPIRERMQFRKQIPFLVLAAVCLALAPVPLWLSYRGQALHQQNERRGGLADKPGKANHRRLDPSHPDPRFHRATPKPG
jgi:type IV pilus assembly protein PilM